MKFNKKRMPKTRTELDEFVREWGLRPEGMFTYKGREIFIAETDLNLEDPTCPWGYYETAWFTTHPNDPEKLDIGQPIIFDAFHDTDENWSQETKRQARVNTAANAAKAWIDKNIKVGRLDA